MRDMIATLIMAVVLILVLNLLLATHPDWSARDAIYFGAIVGIGVATLLGTFIVGMAEKDRQRERRERAKTLDKTTETE